MAKNIFDIRHVMKQTPKMGNRFLLTTDSTQLNKIINGTTTTQSVTDQGVTTTSVSAVTSQPISPMKAMNQLAGGNDAVFGEENIPGRTPTDILNLSLLSCTIPAFEYESAELNRFNDSVKHITKFSTTNDMSAVFYDYINGSATSIMLAWQSAVGFKLNGSINYKKKYTCDMNLYVYGPNRAGYKVAKEANGSLTVDGEDKPEYELLMQFKIINAWPRSVDIGEFSYDSAEIKKASVQFGYDMIIPYKHKVRSLNEALQIKDMASEINCASNGTFSPLAIDDLKNNSFVNTKVTTTENGAVTAAQGTALGVAGTA